MIGKYHLSDTEQEIMDFLWEKGRPITTKEIEEYFNGDRNKNWQRTTLNTHLSRLMLKDVLKRRKNVIEAYPREVFLKKQCQEMLDIYYQGRVSVMLATLCQSKAIEEDDIAVDKILKTMSSR